MNYTKTTFIGSIQFSCIKPLSPDIVRFALTAKIPTAPEHFTVTDLTFYGMLLLTKTKNRNKNAIEEYLKQHGIHLSVKTGHSSITISGHVRQSNIQKAVHLITELLFEPAIDDDEFIQKRKLALEANREAHDDAKRIAHIAFINALYAHEPTLKLETLKEEYAHISRITVKNITKLHHALSKSSWYVSVVGNQKTSEVFLPLIAKLAHTAVAYTHTPIQVAPVEKSIFSINVPSKTNIEVLIGNACTLKNDESNFVALDFGIDVLGKTGGFFGRLMSTVREKEGLTYGIYASIHSHFRGDTVHFNVRTFFMAKDYTQGMTATLREIHKIVTHGISAHELRVFKEISKNQHILAHESNKTRLHLYHELFTHGYTELHLSEYQTAIASLTKVQVNKALIKYIDPKNLVTSCAGPVINT